MPKKLSKIGQMFQRVKEAAASAKQGLLPADAVEQRLEELEQELDQNIIYVNDDGNEIGDDDYKYDGQKQNRSPEDSMKKALLDALMQRMQPKPSPQMSKLQKLAEMLQKLQQMQGGGGMSKTEMMKRLMEDYIGDAPPGSDPAQQMDRAMEKRREFERDFASQLMGMMMGGASHAGGLGHFGSGLGHKMDGAEYRNEEHRRQNFNRDLLKRGSRTKQERGLQRIVRSILTDNKFDRFIGRKTRGRLDSNGLHRFPTNGRIFGQKEERKGKHYTATILVDLSSSMGSRIPSAAPAAMRFHQLLAEIIPVQVRGYNNSFYKFAEFGEKLKKDDPEKIANKMISMVVEGNGTQACLARVGTLPNGQPKYGMMNLPLTPAHQRLIKENGNDYREASFDTRGTLDGTAIRTITDQLSQMPGKHIVIVLNDGGPGQSYQEDVYTWQDGFKTPYTNENLDLKKAVEYAMDRGIMFVGIGIHSDDVERYYPKKFCTVVRHGDDISTAFAGASKQLTRYVHRG